MEAHHLLTWIIIGLIAGTLASRVVEGDGFGCLGDLVIGVAGAIIGGAILHAIAPDVQYDAVGTVVVAFIGAALLLAVLRLLSGGKRLGGLRRGGRRSWW